MGATMMAPARSLEQRHRALERANGVRIARADEKRKLQLLDQTASRIAVAGLIMDPPEWLESMKVFDLLRSMRRWGKVRAWKLMREVDVSERKTVGGLSPRQCREIVKALRGSAS